MTELAIIVNIKVRFLICPVIRTSAPRKTFRKLKNVHKCARKISFFVRDILLVVDELLKQIQSDMFEKARAHRDAHTYVATNYDEFKDIIANKPGFVKAMWCGDRACEDKIKEETTATSRCMPFAQEHLSDVCVCCGRPAKKMVYWGKAY